MFFSTQYINLQGMENTCSSCLKTGLKSNLGMNPLFSCGVCGNLICKNCAQFSDQEQFTYLTELPAALAHDVYCGPCFNKVVWPEIQSYDETMRQAKNMDIFFKDQGKETRLIRRKAKKIEVKDCLDRDSTILRLAFEAAKTGYDLLVDVELVSEKYRTGSYKKVKWSGSGVPAKKE